MVPLPGTGSNVRSVEMQLTQVAYGGCWKCPHDWQRCSANTPCLAASQKGFVHSFGTGIGRVTLLQSLIVKVVYLHGSLVQCSRREAFLTHFSRRVNGCLHLVSDRARALLLWLRSGERPHRCIAAFRDA